VLRNNQGVGQIGLFSRAQLATMRDRTRRRNYSAEAERFRREHERHREWGVAQRHARKLSRLYGSTANAAAVFQRRAEELRSPSADELRSPSGPARAAAPTWCESVGPESAGPESPASVPAPPEPAGPKAIGSEPVEPEPVKPEPVKPEPVELERVVPESVGLELVVPESVEPECVEDAASVSDPGDPGGSVSGHAGRCPDRRFCSGRPGMRRPERPGKHFGPARKGTRRPELARRTRARTGTESPENQARRRVGVVGVKDAYRRRRTPLSARRGRMTSSLPKCCRERIPP